MRLEILKKPLYVLVVCSVVNIVADLILVGLLHTGVGGAAAATVLSQIVSVVLTAYFLVKSDLPGRKDRNQNYENLQRAYGNDDKQRFPVSSSVHAVSNCQFYCSGKY